MHGTRRWAATAVVATVMAVGMAGCTPPETWWPSTAGDLPERRGEEAVVGDFDEDGLDDLLWFGPRSVPEELWAARAEGGFDQVALPQVTGTYEPQVGDFDGDGDDDLLWLGHSGGDATVWLFEAGQVIDRRHTYFPGNRGYETIAVIERATGPDHIAVLMGGGDHFFDTAYVKAPLATAMQDGLMLPTDPRGALIPADFDGDGFGDVLAYGFGSRRDVIWWGRSDGTYDHQDVAVNGSYRITAVDADGDGRDDLAFFFAGSGTPPARIALWRGRTGRWFARTTAAGPTVEGDTWLQRDRADGRDNVVVRVEGADQVWELDAQGGAVVHTIADFGRGVPELGQFSDAARDDLYVWGYGSDRLLLSPPPG